MVIVFYVGYSNYKSYHEYWKSWLAPSGALKIFFKMS